VGGTIRIVNGSRIERGRVVEPRISRRLVPAIQSLEYLRGFLGGRIGWARIGALPIISGAFGAFRRDAVLRVGGFAVGSLGEDMELIVRLRRELRAGWPDMRIDYVPEAVCWTEAPERLRDLRTQRMRWHRGLLEILREHRGVIFDRRHGAFGLLAMPYILMFEAIGPVVEVIGYVVAIGGFAFGLVSGAILAAFLLAAFSVGTLLSMASLLVEEIAFRRYPRHRDLAALLGLAVAENVGYRQLTAVWRVHATIADLLGHDAGWGTIERRAVFAEAASVESGLLTDVPHVDDALAREVGAPIASAPARSAQR
jgi:cellulose synthase/poly-beta-1,6-N-acetylglucosamine synthase-like glycosyltransferase